MSEIHKITPVCGRKTFPRLTRSLPCGRKLFAELRQIFLKRFRAGGRMQRQIMIIGLHKKQIREEQLLRLSAK